MASTLRRTVLCAALCVLATSACRSSAPTVPPGPPPGDHWQTLSTEPYKGKRDDIVFVSADVGFYGTGKGDLFRTTDGGESWSKIWSQPGTFIRSIGFVDAQHGWLGNVGTEYYPGVTDEVPLYETHDGGTSWSPVDLGGAFIKGICSIDIVQTEHIHQGVLEPRTLVHAAGRVGGPASLARSVDGGEHWTVIDMSKDAGMILDVKFIDSNVGFVFAAAPTGAENEGARILKTRDGGATWTAAYQSGRAGENTWKASFPSARVGYATVQSYDPERAQQVVVKTTDGGETWTELALVTDAKAREFGIGFLDENTGWVGTMVGGFATGDGGQTWTKTNLTPASNKFRIRAMDGTFMPVSIGTSVQRWSVPEPETETEP
ncbi:MAG: WD40/YVTN/BNR-like repeat-containing protein [Nannocystales bacterium]